MMNPVRNKIWLSIILCSSLLVCNSSWGFIAELIPHFVSKFVPQSVRPILSTTVQKVSKCMAKYPKLKCGYELAKRHPQKLYWSLVGGSAIGGEAVKRSKINDTEKKSSLSLPAGIVLSSTSDSLVIAATDIPKIRNFMSKHNNFLTKIILKIANVAKNPAVFSLIAFKNIAQGVGYAYVLEKVPEKHQKFKPFAQNQFDKWKKQYETPGESTYDVYCDFY